MAGDDGYGVSYGIKGVPNPTNVPHGRYFGNSFFDSADNFWLYGGMLANNFSGDNIFWKFDGQNWAWMSGEIPNPPANKWIWSSAVDPGVRVDQGISNPFSFPEKNVDNYHWIDSEDQIWFFGGQVLISYSGKIHFIPLNNILKYTTYGSMTQRPINGLGILEIAVQNFLQLIPQEVEWLDL